MGSARKGGPSNHRARGERETVARTRPQINGRGASLIRPLRRAGASWHGLMLARRPGRVGARLVQGGVPSTGPSRDSICTRRARFRMQGWKKADRPPFAQAHQGPGPARACSAARWWLSPTEFGMKDPAAQGPAAPGPRPRREGRGPGRGTRDHARPRTGIVQGSTGT